MSAAWAARRLSALPASWVPTPPPSVSRSPGGHVPVRDSGGGGGAGGFEVVVVVGIPLSSPMRVARLWLVAPLSCAAGRAVSPAARLR